MQVQNINLSKIPNLFSLVFQGSVLIPTLTNFYRAEAANAVTARQNFKTDNKVICLM